MERLACLLTMVSLFVFFGGCGGNSDSSDSKDDKRNTASAEQEKKTGNANGGEKKKNPDTPVRLEPKAPSAELPPAESVDAKLRDQVAALAVQRADGNWHVDNDAMTYLESLGRDSISQVRPLIGDDDVAVRRGAAFYLLEYFTADDPALTAAFIETLNDEDPIIRHIGMQALRRMPADVAVQAAPALGRLLANGQEDAATRAEVARLLGKMQLGAKAALPDLRRVAAEDPDARVRSASLFASSRIGGDAEAVKLYRIALTKDQDASVRRVAATRLGRLPGGDAAAADLAAALGDKSDEVASAAIDSLVAIGSPAVEPLAKQLSSSNTRLRKLSMFALARLGELAKPAVPAIKPLTNDSDPDIQRLAKELLLIFE